MNYADCDHRDDKRLDASLNKTSPHSQTIAGQCRPRIRLLVH
jgi:hypothetical protein